MIASADEAASAGREVIQLNNKKVFDTRTIVQGGLLVVIAFLLGGGFKRVTGIPLSITLNFGGATQSIGFTAVPLILASVTLGPWAGMAVAAIYDTLQYFLITGGVWNPIFTVSEMLVGFLPGLIYLWFKKHNYQKSIFSLMNIALVTYSAIVIVVSSIMSQGSSAGQKATQMISFEGGFHVVNAVLLFGFIGFMAAALALMYFLNRQRASTGLFSFDKLYLMSFVGLLSRSLLSGFGLYLYYGKTVPLIFYWLPRFVTPMFLAPITAFVLSMLGYILKRYAY